MAIDTFLRELPHGITLSCRAAGEPGRPLMLFLHGFPEAAFVWDTLLEHFARPENGGYRCVAPNLRGFERSSAPTEVSAYRPQLLIQDIAELAKSESPDTQGHVDTLVAHDWGGAVGWAFAHAHPDALKRLVILNSPHPGTFARELRNNPAQQQASAYMNWLCRPDAEAKLAENDFQRLFNMLSLNTAGQHDQPAWLSEAVKQQYREVWGLGMTGGCNLYRVTPLKPPVPGQRSVDDIPLPPPERVSVSMPTLVLWAMNDVALLPGLMEGLEAYVPQLTLRPIPDGSHWVVHEHPHRVAEEIRHFQQQRL